MFKSNNVNQLINKGFEYCSDSPYPQEALNTVAEQVKDHQFSAVIVHRIHERMDKMGVLDDDWIDAGIRSNNIALLPWSCATQRILNPIHWGTANLYCISR